MDALVESLDFKTREIKAMRSAKVKSDELQEKRKDSMMEPEKYKQQAEKNQQKLHGQIVLNEDTIAKLRLSVEKLELEQVSLLTQLKEQESELKIRSKKFRCSASSLLQK